MDLEKHQDILIAYRVVISTWKQGLRFLMRETDYFWEQAINGPNVKDFTRLKASKIYAATMYQDLGAWMVLMKRLLAPEIDRGGARAMNELKDLLDQILAFKQEIGDTFQLLIGAIAIKDSEIQKKLARESKLQARRSTALTALAAIYLPLSLTTGVFGMNILEIDQGKPRYWTVLAMGLGLLVVTLPFLVWVFLDKDDEDDIVKSQSKTRGSHHDDKLDAPGDCKDVSYRRSTVRQAMANPREFLRRRRVTSPSTSHDGREENRRDVPNSTAKPELMV
jgi:hypothetical protein